MYEAGDVTKNNINTWPSLPQPSVSSRLYCKLYMYATSHSDLIAVTLVTVDSRDIFACLTQRGTQAVNPYWSLSLSVHDCSHSCMPFILLEISSEMCGLTRNRICDRA